MNNTPSLKIFHPNAKCTGCAIRLTLIPAKEMTDGRIVLEMIPQKTLGKRDEQTGAVICVPSFDYEKSIKTNLRFDDVCKFIEVFRGYYESIESGKGLFHRYATRAVAIRLEHIIEPVQGYRLTLAERNSDSGEQREMHIYFSPSEALGICGAFEGSLAALAFGNP